MIYIWHEDSQNSATTNFWNFIYNSKVSAKLVNVSIRGFDGNKNLADHMKNCSINMNDTYLIFVDKVLDNPKALQYYIDIKNTCLKYKNVHVVDLLCFEYMMLRFKYIINWTEPMKIIKGYEEARAIRNDFINCIDNGIAWVNNPNIVKYVVKKKNINTSLIGWQRELAYVSSENIATDLLTQMTNGGTTEFGISKTNFGRCWYCNCCPKHSKAVGNKKCRMFRYTKTSQDKARNLWNGTLARQIIDNAL